MISLPNNCYCSEPVVIPKNWKQLKKISGPWRIHCRFYDPSVLDETGKIKVFHINKKSINILNQIDARKQVAQTSLRELRQALVMGYNPRHKKIIANRNTHEIEPTSFFIEAFRRAISRLKILDKTKKQMTYQVNAIEKITKQLGYQHLQISEVRRKHIIFLLDSIRENNPRFTDNTFNKYRTYLSILFDELLQVDAIDSNPIRDIKKKSVEQKERETLTPAQRKYVNEYLKENYPDFHRFLHIFFHSGSRITELLKLKGSDVDLQAQKFKREIKKGRKTRIEWTPIKNIALPYWSEAVQNCTSTNDFLFSVGLKGGTKRIQPYQITKRWYRLIKQKGIATADFYSLKHLNSTEMVDHLSEQAAAILNGHQSTAMVRKIYDTKQKDREHEKIKGVNNAF